MRARPVPAMTLRWARELARRLRREEDGQTLLLGVGLICVVLALLFVAASATAIYLDLKTLTSLADSAAAAGADGLEEDSYYGGNGTDTAPAALTDAQVRTNAAADLSAQPSAARLAGVHHGRRASCQQHQGGRGCQGDREHPARPEHRADEQTAVDRKSVV